MGKHPAKVKHGKAVSLPHHHHNATASAPAPAPAVAAAQQHHHATSKPHVPTTAQPAPHGAPATNANQHQQAMPSVNRQHPVTNGPAAPQYSPGALQTAATLLPLVGLVSGKRALPAHGASRALVIAFVALAMFFVKLMIVAGTIVPVHALLGPAYIALTQVANADDLGALQLIFVVEQAFVAIPMLLVYGFFGANTMMFISYTAVLFAAWFWYRRGIPIIRPPPSASAPAAPTQGQQQHPNTAAPAMTHHPMPPPGAANVLPPPGSYHDMIVEVTLLVIASVTSSYQGWPNGSGATHIGRVVVANSLYHGPSLWMLATLYTGTMCIVFLLRENQTLLSLRVPAVSHAVYAVSQFQNLRQLSPYVDYCFDGFHVFFKMVLPMVFVLLFLALDEREGIPLVNSVALIVGAFGCGLLQRFPPYTNSPTPGVGAKGTANGVGAAPSTPPAPITPYSTVQQTAQQQAALTVHALRIQPIGYCLYYLSMIVLLSIGAFIVVNPTTLLACHTVAMGIFMADALCRKMQEPPLSIKQPSVMVLQFAIVMLSGSLFLTRSRDMSGHEQFAQRVLIGTSSHQWSPSAAIYRLLRPDAAPPSTFGILAPLVSLFDQVLLAMHDENFGRQVVAIATILYAGFLSHGLLFASIAAVRRGRQEKRIRAALNAAETVANAAKPLPPIATPAVADTQRVVATAATVGTTPSTSAADLAKNTTVVPAAKSPTLIEQRLPNVPSNNNVSDSHASSLSHTVSKRNSPTTQQASNAASAAGGPNASASLSSGSGSSRHNVANGSLGPDVTLVSSPSAEESPSTPTVPRAAPATVAPIAMTPTSGSVAEMPRPQTPAAQQTVATPSAASTATLVSPSRAIPCPPASVSVDLDDEVPPTVAIQQPTPTPSAAGKKAVAAAGKGKSAPAPAPAAKASNNSAAVKPPKHIVSVDGDPMLPVKLPTPTAPQAPGMPTVSAKNAPKANPSPATSSSRLPTAASATANQQPAAPAPVSTPSTTSTPTNPNAPATVAKPTAASATTTPNNSSSAGGIIIIKHHKDKPAADAPTPTANSGGSNSTTVPVSTTPAAAAILVSKKNSTPFGGSATNTANSLDIGATAITDAERKKNNAAASGASSAATSTTKASGSSKNVQSAASVGIPIPGAASLAVTLSRAPAAASASTPSSSATTNASTANAPTAAKAPKAVELPTLEDLVRGPTGGGSASGVTSPSNGSLGHAPPAISAAYANRPALRGPMCIDGDAVMFPPLPPSEPTPQAPIASSAKTSSGAVSAAKTTSANSGASNVVQGNATVSAARPADPFLAAFAPAINRADPAKTRPVPTVAPPAAIGLDDEDEDVESGDDDSSAPDEASVASPTALDRNWDEVVTPSTFGSNAFAQIVGGAGSERRASSLPTGSQPHSPASNFGGIIGQSSEGSFVGASVVGKSSVTTSPVPPTPTSTLPLDNNSGSGSGCMPVAIGMGVALKRTPRQAHSIHNTTGGGGIPPAPSVYGREESEDAIGKLQHLMQVITENTIASPSLGNSTAEGGFYGATAGGGVSPMPLRPPTAGHSAFGNPHHIGNPNAANGSGLRPMLGFGDEDEDEATDLLARLTLAGLGRSTSMVGNGNTINPINLSSPMPSSTGIGGANSSAFGSTAVLNRQASWEGGFSGVSHNNNATLNGLNHFGSGGGALGPTSDPSLAGICHNNTPITAGDDFGAADEAIIEGEAWDTLMRDLGIGAGSDDSTNGGNTPQQTYTASSTGGVGSFTVTGHGSSPSHYYTASTGADTTTSANVAKLFAQARAASNNNNGVGSTSGHQHRGVPPAYLPPY